MIGFISKLFWLKQQLQFIIDRFILGKKKAWISFTLNVSVTLYILNLAWVAVICHMAMSNSNINAFRVHFQCLFMLYNAFSLITNRPSRISFRCSVFWLYSAGKIHSWITMKYLIHFIVWMANDYYKLFIFLMLSYSCLIKSGLGLLLLFIYFVDNPLILQ